MLVSEEQRLKALLSILVTLSGIVMLVSDVQPEKAPPPILVTLSGIVMLVSDVQPKKALSAIIFVPCFISTLPDISSLASIK